MVFLWKQWNSFTKVKFWTSKQPPANQVSRSAAGRDGSRHRSINPTWCGREAAMVTDTGTPQVTTWPYCSPKALHKEFKPCLKQQQVGTHTIQHLLQLLSLVPMPPGDSSNPKHPFALSTFISETMLHVPLVLNLRCPSSSMNPKAAKKSGGTKKDFCSFPSKNPPCPTYADLRRLWKLGNRKKSISIWCCWAKYP